MSRPSTLSHADLQSPELITAASMIREHEGYRRTPYTDTVGVMTIGIGRNLERGLSDDEVEYLYGNDLRLAYNIASSYTYYDLLNHPRRVALLDMAFQLGATRLAGFVRMHAALERHDYAAAARECLDSKYARQVPARARKIAALLESGSLS